MSTGSINKFGINKQIFISFFVVLSIVLYFSYHTISGNKGVFKYFELRKYLQEKNLTRNTLYDKKQHKQNMVDSMSLKSLNLDLLDEQTRRSLGHAGKNEIIIYEK